MGHSFNSGAIHRASERDQRSNERAIETRVRAIQESVGLGDELFIGAEFLTGIAETCLFLDRYHFVGADRNPGIGVPGVFRPVEGPPERSGRAWRMRSFAEPTDGGAT